MLMAVVDVELLNKQKRETITAMDSELPPLAVPKRPRVHVTPEELERFGDEDLMRRASNDDWLRDEAPPHHDR
jgi:hypothetical protein